MLQHLRHTLSGFFSDETGSVKQRSSLPVAWAIGILIGAAVFLGTPDKAEAATCWAYPNCNPRDGYAPCYYACIDNCNSYNSQGCVEYTPGFYMCKCIV